jgi:L-lactate dehydrogenase complex protein LldG
MASRKGWFGMTARADILGKIRDRQGMDDDTARAATVTDRLRRAPRGVIPAYGQLNDAGRLNLFVKAAKEAAATVDLVDSTEEIPPAVLTFLRDHNFPAAARVGGDPLLAQIPWENHPQLVLSHGASDGSDIVGISHAANGVAESGTLVVHTGPGNPTTLNFLPDAHIVVIHPSEIVGDYESCWDQLREARGKGVMPRTVNMITGPSRSGDIEQKLIMGAHGPRNLHIIVLKNA